MTTAETAGDCHHCTLPYAAGDKVTPVGIHFAHAGCPYYGSRLWLFETFIHPVLDLSQVSMSKDLDINAEALDAYLFEALADFKEKILHDAANLVLETAHKLYASDIDMLTAAKLIHPECGECAEENR